MQDKELRELVRGLASALLDAVSDLESADDDFKEGKYAKEMAYYDKAVAWLKEQNYA
jgi:hypothetical protein